VTGQRNLRIDRLLAAAVVAAEAGVLALIWWAGLRERPIEWDCSDVDPPANETLVPAFQAGAPIIHAAAALVVLAALVTLSTRRRAAPGSETRPGGPTLAAAVLVALIALACVLAPDPIGQAVISTAGLLGLVTYGLPALAAAILLGYGAVSRTSGADIATAIGLWLVVIVLLPTHALLVYLQGYGPLFC
jgi:hypothetical protein